MWSSRFVGELWFELQFIVVDWLLLLLCEHLFGTGGLRDLSLSATEEDEEGLRMLPLLALTSAPSLISRTEWFDDVDLGDAIIPPVSSFPLLLIFATTWAAATATAAGFVLPDVIDGDLGLVKANACVCKQRIHRLN